MRQSIRVGSRHRGRSGHRYITPLTALTRLGTTRPASALAVPCPGADAALNRTPEPEAGGSA